MAYLNAEERQKLLNDLSKMNFNRARGKLRSLNGKMTMFRNVQSTGNWVTQYNLDGKGTVVTLYEFRDLSDDDPNTRHNAKYEFQRVEVEPTPDNQT